ncbi:MAG TPA: hypothetical protein VNF27_10585 [Candidatus Binataceae bacterium]|nr:hypothetical protein [Candidatus Binataceae bacterium]
MKASLSRLALAAFAIVAALWLVAVSAPAARAQMTAMGMPIPTTIVITKPAPGQVFGDQQVVTMGVGTKKYKFVLNDGYVNTMNDRVRFPDIWQYVKIHQPNFVVQGVDADTFEKIEPGQQMTITGMFAPLDRTFEVQNTELGKGALNPHKAY